MADREKVIKELECCLDHPDCNPETYCANPCSHGILNGGDGRCVVGLIEDAISLLKAQEPRVLTLDEALEADVCWLEKKGDDRVWPCEVGGGEKWVAIWRFDQETTVMRRDEYGKLFRCWSARPTEEDREKVKWYGE